MDDPIMDDDAGNDGGGNLEEVVEFVGDDGAVILGPNLEHLTLDVLREAVETRPELVRAKDAANGWTLLHHAVHLGWEIDMVEYLLEVGPDAARTRARNNGPLPIHLVNRRTPESVALLVAQQWPEALHLSNEPYEEGNALAPFHCAIKNGATGDVCLLLFLLRYEPALAASAAWRSKIRWMAMVLGDQYEAMDAELREFSRETTAQDGELALRLALEANDDGPVIRLVLLAWPASIRTRSRKGWTFLHFAVANGLSHSAVAYLAYRWKQAARERDDGGCLPIHYARSFTTQWPDAAQVLVKLYPESLRQKNKAGEIPLHWAARSNSLPLVQFLVEAYPEGVHRRSNRGKLPLHKAVDYAPPEGGQVVPYLVQRWPESVRETANDGRTVLHLAGEGRGGPGLVDLLVGHDFSLLHARATDGALPLHDAAEAFEDLATVRRLIELNPEAVHATTNLELTPLHMVSRHPDEDSAVALARILVQRAPDLVRTRAIRRRLPIHWAAKIGPFRLVEFLVEFWPESIECVDDDSYTPLHNASSSQQPEVVRYLADRRPEALALRTSVGLLPLHIAAKFQSSLPSVQVLVERRPRALWERSTDGRGYLPLHLAVVRKDPPPEIVQYLAEVSPGTLRVRDASGALPVELAARTGAPLDVIFVLLKTWPECLLPRRDSVAVKVRGNVNAMIGKVIRRGVFGRGLD